MIRKFPADPASKLSPLLVSFSAAGSPTSQACEFSVVISGQNDPGARSLPSAFKWNSVGPGHPPEASDLSDWSVGCSSRRALGRLMPIGCGVASQHRDGVIQQGRCFPQFLAIGGVGGRFL